MLAKQETSTGTIWRKAWPIEGVWREVAVDDQEGSLYLSFGSIGAGKVYLPVDDVNTIIELGKMLQTFGKSRAKKIEVRYEE